MGLRYIYHNIISCVFNMILSKGLYFLFNFIDAIKSILIYLITELKSRTCSSSWAFERVRGFELRGFTRRKYILTSRFDCMERCLSETDFECRSFNYNNGSGDCFLSQMDRHAIPLNPPGRLFIPSSSSSSKGSLDYFETNCIDGNL